MGVAIGDSVLDLSGVASFYPPEVQVSVLVVIQYNSYFVFILSFFYYNGFMQDALNSETLNKLMSLGYNAWNVVRSRTRELLLKNSQLEQNAELVKR